MNCRMHTQISYKLTVSCHKINYAMNFGTWSFCFSQDPAKCKVSSDVEPTALLRSGVTREELLKQ